VDDTRDAEDLIKRLAAAIRASALYTSAHPLANRTTDLFARALDDQFRRASSLTIGILGDDIIVRRTRLTHSASFAGIVRHLQERDVEKLTFSRNPTRDGLNALIAVLADRDLRGVRERLTAAGVNGVDVGLIATDPATPDDTGVLAARQVYGLAVQAAEAIWGAAGAGDAPDPQAAQTIVEALSNAVTQDRSSMIALTTLKAHDAYTFSHMVNVSLLTMAQARTLGIQGSLLREFGLAGLMHDIGKVKTPPELLVKADRLTGSETALVQRHVIDGAHLLRRTSNMPALPPVVAFEHHLKYDFSGYPEGIGRRALNLCTMLVSISDVFDALRTKRPYRDALPTERVRAMIAAQSGGAFEPTLLRRFITLMGLFPVGCFVRMRSGEVGVVTAEHTTDPFRPQARVVLEADGTRLPAARRINTWERNDSGEYSHTVLEAVEPGALALDPLTLMS